MFFADRQGSVLGPGAAFVGGRAEKHRAPKGIHGGQVMLPINASNFVEDGAEQFVAPDAVVKVVDELFDVVFCYDVLQTK